jgi:hypothetical protein
VTEEQGWLLIVAVLLTDLDGWQRNAGGAVLVLGILFVILRGRPRTPAP